MKRLAHGAVVVVALVTLMAPHKGAPYMLLADARSQGAATPTFNRDVAPILFSSCVMCHRQNAARMTDESIQ